jgi:peptide/nickel transport system substrate-binding protein
VLAGDAGSKVVDELDPLKTPVAVAMVGRADPDVIKSQYYPTNRNVLVQKGGVSDKVKTFSDDKLNTILDEIASQPDREKRLKAVADAQAYVLDQAYAVPIFEEPQAYAGAPYVKGIAFEAVGRPSFYNTWLDK